MDKKQVFALITVNVVFVVNFEKTKVKLGSPFLRCLDAWCFPARSGDGTPGRVPWRLCGTGSRVSSRGIRRRRPTGLWFRSPAPRHRAPPHHCLPWLMQQQIDLRRTLETAVRSPKCSIFRRLADDTVCFTDDGLDTPPLQFLAPVSEARETTF